MADKAAGSILKRMARAEAHEGGPAAPARILGGAIARVAEALFRLPAVIADVAAPGATLAELGERLDAGALLMLVEGPGERLGLAALSPGLFSAAVEVLTTGRLTPGAAAARRPTRTDAALCSDLVDHVLREADAAAPEGEAPWEEWEPGFRHASCIDDARLLPLLLEDTRYRFYRAAFTLGEGGGRDACLTLALPERQRAMPAPAAVAAQAADWQDELAATVLGVRGEVVAVLARLRRSVSEMMAMRVGDCLRLPDDALAAIRIEGAGGRVITQAKLGQYRGYLAVRLTGVPDLGQDRRGSEPGMEEGFALAAAAGPPAPPGGRDEAAMAGREAAGDAGDPLRPRSGD